MADNVHVDLSGEMDTTNIEKRGMQKHINNMKSLMQNVRSGAFLPMIMAFLSSRKAWTQFIITDNYKVPTSFSRLTRRFYRNLDYFQGNYFFIFLGLFVYCLITTPLLLLGMAANYYGYRKLSSIPNNWKVFGIEINKSQQHVLFTIASITLCWIAGAGAVLFWVLGATLTVVALHASFYDTEALQEAADPEQFPMMEEV